MSRFADLDARRRVDLGACLCPGTPHASDWVDIRSELSANDIRRFVRLAVSDDGNLAADVLVEYVVEWNLLGPDGEPWPPSAEAFLALKVATLEAIVAALNTAVEESAIVPKPSGAPSRGSSRGSASRTPTRRPTPTT